MTPKENVWTEPLVEQTVTYHIEIDGRLLLIENVPARVNVETGERYFAPETVERLQQAVWGHLATPALAPSPKDTSPQGAPLFGPRHGQIHS